MNDEDTVQDRLEADAAEAEAKAKAEEAAALAEQEALAVEQRAQAESSARAAEQEEAEKENDERDTVAAGLAAIAAANAAATPTPLPVFDTVDAPRGSFGPTFWGELVAAGASTFPFVFNPDHVIFAPGIKPEERAKVLAVIEAHDPEAEPPPPVVIVSSVDFYRRMTPEEADQVEGVIAQQSARDRRIFEKANTFRSDAPEWPTLYGLAIQLFKEARAKELLAPSEG